MLGGASQLVYAGRAGGSFYTHGGGSNYACMPNMPEYTLRYSSGVQGYSYMYDVEYQGHTLPNKDNLNADVPCAIYLIKGHQL